MPILLWVLAITGAFVLGLHLGYRVGQADQRMRQFVELQRRRRNRAAILELQQRARFESERG